MTPSSELYVAGTWQPPADDGRIVVLSPHDRSFVGSAAAAGPADIDAAVHAARSAFDTGEWPRLRPPERIEVIRRLAAAYGERVDEVARLISAENGSPLTFSQIGQAGAIPLLFDGFLRAADGFAWEEEVVVGAFGPSTIVREPVGLFGVNTFAPATDMPFGGFKASGIGRECGVHGPAELVEVKCLHGA